MIAAKENTSIPKKGQSGSGKDDENDIDIDKMS